MPRCPAVDTATAEYRGEQDRLKQFLEDCTEPAPGYTIQAGILYQVYRRWCEENGERYPLTGNKFGREIAKALQRTKTRTNFAYQDVRLTDEGNRLMAYDALSQSGPARVRRCTNSSAWTPCPAADRGGLWWFGGGFEPKSTTPFLTIF